jgi:hypothetical protein
MSEADRCSGKRRAVKYSNMRHSSRSISGTETIASRHTWEKARNPSGPNIENLMVFAAVLAGIVAFFRFTSGDDANPYRDLSEALLLNRPYFGEAMLANQEQPSRSRHFIQSAGIMAGIAGGWKEYVAALIYR